MTWLAEEDWERIQGLLPIVVVDVVPLEMGSERIGLIRRETPHQGVRWNLVGGRIRYGETLGQAIGREVRAALGDHVTVTVADEQQPDFVAHYGPFGRTPFLGDPRKHAVSLTYALPVEGTVEPRGEALAFEWFDSERLPSPADWGFDQHRAAEACLRKRGIAVSFAAEPGARGKAATAPSL